MFEMSAHTVWVPREEDKVEEEGADGLLFWEVIEDSGDRAGV